MLKIGIVGLPNVGKSTLFNTLIKKKSAVSANYPFCTIEPNIGIVSVPDQRIDKIVNIVHPENIVFPVIEFVDIAGLVKGASQGEGLGNKFLANIRECDAIAQVVRIFEDKNVHHVHGQINPNEDIEIINTELIISDVESLKRQKSNIEKKAKGGDKESKESLGMIEKILPILESGRLLYTISFTEEEKTIIKKFHLLTQKPFLYIANIHENAINNEKTIEKHFFLSKEDHSPIISICAKLEEELLEMEESDQKEYLHTLGIKESGLDCLIRNAYSILGLQSFFTAGIKEVRAWTIKKGDLAPQAAGVIHSDFEKKFIRAEVISYENFIQHGGWKGGKDAGISKIEGKEYIVQDGDVMNFLHNA